MNRLVIAAALMLTATAAAAQDRGDISLHVGSYDGSTTVMAAATVGPHWGLYGAVRMDAEEEDVIMCNDGWISDSTNRSGTCSWHGGVFDWDADNDSAAVGVMYKHRLGSHGTSIRGQVGFASVRQGGWEVNYAHEYEGTIGVGVEQMVGEKVGLSIGYDTFLGAHAGVVLKF